ncbi:MAG: aromatic amino acid transport family protein [Nanoarchaeota archaeon]
MSTKPLLEAIATMVGFIIGAGILGIPYVINKSGLIIGIINIIIIGMVMMIVNLFYGEVVLRTKGYHQITGHAKKYLGNRGKIIMFFCVIFGMYGSMIAYTIKQGEFLHTLLSGIFGGNVITYSILFFLALHLIIYKGINLIKKFELFMVLLIFLICLTFFAVSFKQINLANLQLFSTANWYLPYGVVLFAFMGLASIPELKEELKNNWQQLKKAIIIGSALPIIIYSLFAVFVIGITGNNTTDGAIIGLASSLSGSILIICIIFGMLTIATSFIGVGLALKDIFHRDLEISRQNSTLLITMIPLFALTTIMTIKIKNPFFRIIDVTGKISYGIIGILVVLMYVKAKKMGDRKLEYEIQSGKTVRYIIISIFVIGILSGLLPYL